MIYILIILVIPVSLYTFSFARYSWKKKEKLAAVGAAILGTLAIFFPLLTLIIK